MKSAMDFGTSQLQGAASSPWDIKVKPIRFIKGWSPVAVVPRIIEDHDEALAVHGRI